MGGCIFYLIASLHPDAQRSWTKSIPDFFKWSLRKRYVTSLYLAVTTFSTVGYGDLHPESQAEMIFSLIYMIWNIGFAAYIGLLFTSMIERIVKKHVSNILFKLLLHMLCVFNVLVLNKVLNYIATLH